MKRTPTTTATPIISSGAGPLASVNAGMPISAALEHVSCILWSIEDLASSIAESGLQGSEMFAIKYLAEAAKGLVDASIHGLLKQESDAGVSHEQTA